jgi:hypothetical protein
MTVIVDVQGFNTSKKTFTPKELAAYDGTCVSHYIFKPPFSFHTINDEFKKQAFWLTNNHHCLDWNEGFTPLFMFPQIIQRLTKNADSISVKGYEKAAYLRKFVSKPVIELQEQPALTPSTPSCFYHLKSPSICALSNVYYLYETFVMK